MIVTPVAPTQCKSGGQSAACATAPDADAVRIEPQLGRVIKDVAQPLVAIVDRRGVGRFGGQSVLDAEADAGERAAPCA